MSNKSYAYDPQGNRHETYLKNGVTTTIDGKRLQSGWTSQTAGGIYKMGDDGRGVKVESHNQSLNNVTPKNTNQTNTIVNNNVGDRFKSTDSGYTDENYNHYRNIDYAPSGSGMNVNTGLAYNQDQIDNATFNNKRVIWGDAVEDPNSYQHAVVRTSDGRITTVDKNKAEYYANRGYEILGYSKGKGVEDVKRAMMMNTAGSDWEDDGYNNGNVLLRSERGGISSTNARAALNKINSPDKYGVTWSLDPRSQSISRALQSGRQLSYDQRNNSIRKGGLSADEYNNMDFRKTDAELGLEYYMRQVNPSDGDPYEYESQRWKFDGGDGIGNWGKAIDRKLGNGTKVEPTTEFKVKDKGKSEVKELVMPSGNTAHQDSGSFFIIKPNGQKAEINEAEYQQYIMLEFGI